VQRERFAAWAQLHQLRPLEDAWIEQLCCQECMATLFWQVRRDSDGTLSIHPLPDGVKTQLQELSRQLRQITP
jgi:hypothetical protein